jgi:hypothetical protein
MFRKLATAVLSFGASVSGVMLAISVVFDGWSQLTPSRALGFLGLGALVTAGYALSLWLARAHFRPDARLGGRRDAIAGVLAIVLLLAASIATQGAHPAVRLAFCLAAGAASALLAHFPWLQRAKTESPVEAVHADA